MNRYDCQNQFRPATRAWQLRRPTSVTLAVCIAAVPVLLAAQAAGAARYQAGRGRGNVAQAEVEQPVLWRDHGSMNRLDLFHGATSESRAPKPPFTFLKEDSSGTKPKIQVRDANDMTWSVKFDRRSGRGREVPAEIAASRIAWALGYFVEESYLVRDGAIADVAGLQRGKRVLDERGHFVLARFEPRPDEVKRLDLRWTVADNPFARTQEMSGLVILAALLNDWDFRAGNTTALRVKRESGHETRYLVSDWGTAFGRMSPRRSRWDLEDYREQVQFFTVKGDEVELSLHADDAPEPSRVPREHARWFVSRASQLTVEQMRRAFEAAGATPQERDGFATAVKRRIDALRQAVE